MLVCGALDIITIPGTRGQAGPLTHGNSYAALFGDVVCEVVAGVDVSDNPIPGSLVSTRSSLAVLSSVLSSGQSAIASEPSAIASASR